MNKVCVYAIAKNESQFVEQWVKSMSNADHIIVLDTGSTDNTVELLSSLGVEVHQKTYEHFRFDIARNDSLALVPEEYNIRVCTDIDERFEQDNWADILREEWDEEKPRAIYHYVWSHTIDGKPGLEFNINKIHGTDPDLYWLGAVHEHLASKKTGKREFKEYIDLRNKIILHHYADFTKDRNFYISLAEERIQEESDDYQSFILLGNEYKVKGFPEKAIEKYLYTLEHFKDKMNTIEISAIYYALGDAYYATGNAVDAMVSYSHGIAIHKTYRDNYYGLAVIYLNNKMYDATVGILKEALKNTVQAYYWMEDPYTWTFALYDALGHAYSNLGDYEKAVAAAACALSYEPSNEILQSNYNKYIQLLKK